MTDIAEKAASVAACVGNAITEGIKDSAIAGGVGATYTALTAPADAVIATAIAATPAELGAAAFTAISPKRQVVMFSAAVSAAVGALYGTAKGCTDALEQQEQQQRVLNHVAKAAASQAHMSPAEKASAVEAAAKHVLTPDPQAVQDISK